MSKQSDVSTKRGYSEEMVSSLKGLANGIGWMPEAGSVMARTGTQGPTSKPRSFQITSAMQWVFGAQGGWKFVLWCLSPFRLL